MSGDEGARIGVFRKCAMIDQSLECGRSPTQEAVWVVPDKMPNWTVAGHNQLQITVAVIGEFLTPSRSGGPRLFVRNEKSARALQVSFTSSQGEIKLSGTLPRLVGICALGHKLTEDVASYKQIIYDHKLDYTRPIWAGYAARQVDLAVLTKLPEWQNCVKNES